MKKMLILSVFLLTSGCSHVTEEIIGYNESGQTVVKICKSRGNLANAAAFGSDCKIELRDYGRISNKSNTINVISNDKR